MTIAPDLINQFHDACVAYDLNLDGLALASTLEAIAKELAQNSDFRYVLNLIRSGARNYKDIRVHSYRQQLGAGTQTWPDLCQLWKSITEAQISSPDQGPRVICVSLAKFTRNLVAAVPENQVRAL